MPSEIRAMTYNIRYDNPNDGENIWRWRRDHVASVIRFHKPDLVGLQEALHEQLEDLRERLPSYQWVSAGREDGEYAGEYCAIGYDKERFNLEDQSTFWLSEAPSKPGSIGWDATLPRIVTYARLRERTTGVELSHFNTHLDHDGERARAESAKLLLTKIDELAPDTPAVLTGDFNTLESDEPYEILTGRDRSSTGRTILDTHQAAKHIHHGPTSTFNDFEELVPGKKIDYVFVTSDVEVIQHGACSDTYEDGQYPSDHLPVVVDLSLPEMR